MEKSEYALPSLPTIAPRSFCKAHILVSLRQTTGHVRPGPLRGVGNTEQTLAGGYRVVGMRQTPIPHRLGICPDPGRQEEGEPWCGASRGRPGPGWGLLN